MNAADHKNGFIDPSGRLVITPKYDMSFDFENGLAMVSRSGKWHFNEMTFTNYEGQWGYVDRTGSEIWPPRK